ncbi:hypothetical protein [Alicyclobacillus fastidiosus]|uniref:Uncharacterized protein n=1 Tax=Alicyclobacillus fastidiosus TaxID=392011 RepID=A0ABV5AK69_9BACL|nr:hypothetical protein [Alicyclobacillus fastidiosus]WEH10993.1 hypothetical protein PYS47_07185 [Alicyclobacillus fastidiosus]
MTMTTVFGVIAVRLVMQQWEKRIRLSVYPYEEALKRVESHHPLRRKESRQSKLSRPDDAVQPA